MRIIRTILASATVALATNEWTAFGAKSPDHVSPARRENTAGVLFDLSRRDLLDTAIDANSSLSDCDVDGVVQCKGGIGDNCCAAGSECCGGIGCCDAGFKCGLQLLGKCCREDQDVCGENGCYSAADGEACCGDYQVCSKGQECCGVTCCGADEVCDDGILCKAKSEINVDTDEDECCQAGGCCPSGSYCHERKCVPGAAGRIGALSCVELTVLVGVAMVWVM